MKQHCCYCEVARRQNLVLWLLCGTISLGSVCAATVEFFNREWLGFAGWAFLTVQYSFNPLLQRRYCAIHEGRHPPGPLAGQH